MNETNFCPCDECWRKQACTNECKTFKEYVSGETSTIREKILDEFVKLQSIMLFNHSDQL